MGLWSPCRQKDNISEQLQGRNWAFTAICQLNSPQLKAVICNDCQAFLKLCFLKVPHCLRVRHLSITVSNQIGILTRKVLDLITRNEEGV